MEYLELLNEYYKDSGYIAEYWLVNENDKIKTKVVYQHTRVWEQYHRRSLPKNWAIHHKNYIKTDNRIENLLALPKREHIRRFHTIVYKCNVKILPKIECCGVIND